MLYQKKKRHHHQDGRKLCLKSAPFSLTPDTDDDYVYMDEFVNFLVNKYGNASEPTGVKGYSVDNEPALWTSTHSRMHPEKVTCEEIINKTVDLSKAVKNVDPYAEIFGPALYGFAAFESLQSAPDWDEKEEDYRWFIDYYLDSMKKAADRENRRLLDVLDVHWYPEAQGGGARICFGEDQRNIECNKARLQALEHYGIQHTMKIAGLEIIKGIHSRYYLVYLIRSKAIILELSLPLQNMIMAQENI